ncbi:uncharacterized protein LOC125568281 [Nematostella vectensis]|uniref:uncharacterized protein LOC125568281 n=1 Tax=Nematostella vectensis TaxID=45351 RepID=UPI0020776932|nr:uncharacterized protein LOC125568281 [Nematostella vectensis]
MSLSSSGASKGVTFGEAMKKRLALELEKYEGCHKGPLDIRETVSERRYGLGYTSQIKCMHCEKVNSIRNSDVRENGNRRGPKTCELDEWCILGAIHSGNGNTQMEHIFAPIGLPFLSHSAYKKVERRVGKEIESVARGSCANWLDEEKRLSQGADVVMSYDMGWQKRGHYREQRSGL